MKRISHFFKRSFFSKVYFVNVLVIVSAIVLLIAVVTESVTKETLEQEVAFNLQILENIEKYMNEKKNVVRQIIQPIYLVPESYSYVYDLLESISNNYLVKLENKNKLEAFLYSNFIRDTGIFSIAVYSNNEDKSYYYSLDSLYMSNESYYKNLDWFSEFDDNLPGLMITPAYIFDQRRLFTIGINMKSRDVSSNQGVLLVSFYAEFIKDVYHHYEERIKGELYIFDPRGDIIFDSSGQYDRANVDAFLPSILQASDSLVSLDIDKHVINVHKGEMDFIVAGIIPKADLYSNVNKIKKYIYTIGFIFLNFSILINFFSLSFLIRRIRRVIQAIKNFPNKDITEPSPIHVSEDEIGQIEFRFNMMQEQLSQYIKDVYVAEINQKHANWEALQSKIHPHFLANTLEAIRMKALAEGNEEVADMIYILSSLFRRIIKDGTTIQIKEEMKNCELYLKLFSYRFQDILHVQFQVEEQILSHEIPKLLLQPIVENALIHGTDLSKGGNRIIISGEMEGDIIALSVTDNGPGISNEKLSTLLSAQANEGSTGKQSMGLKNVNERCKLLFGAEYGISIKSEENRGTTVTIRMPESFSKGVQHV